ncbi:MAG TPA: FAD-binding oxidoreductase [Kribbellaceae bacterium]|nr:FAD-binding oxidoreductase [Kribbellaceae bacterium]
MIAETLRHQLRGAVHLPGTDEYDAQRVTLNPALDPRPALVAETVTPADVQHAVLAARQHDLPLAVQATGHGTMVPADGGVLVRTTAMAEVLVNPDRRIARVGPGARWADVIAAAAPFGLAPVSGSSLSVGVTGYTFGGGLGWLSRKYGLAAESLVRADLVTADGRLVTASADRNPDLFWAIRGGGGNFGIATALEFRLHPVSRVYAGTAYFPIARAAAVLERFGDWARAEQPDELGAAVIVQRSGPGIDEPVVAIRGLYAGSAGDAVRALQPVWEVAGEPLLDRWEATDFTASGSIGGTAPRNFETLTDLQSGVVEDAIAAVTSPEPGANAVEFRHWGGALARPGLDAGPAAHRDWQFSLTIDGPDGLFASYATGASFLNWLHDTSRTHTAFTSSDYALLRDLKRTWDPDNALGLTHNIAPATAESTRTAG